MNSRVLENVKPYDVFKYFEEMSQIPRGSGYEKAISDYLVKFAKDNNLEVIQDSALNVIIKKPATEGYENAPTVILQGHMDMVNEKNVGTEHDFDKDPLKLRIVDDMIYATGTTLGADNGIAVAYALAALASKDLSHPALEVLVTTEEETGMGGALALDPSSLKGKMLVNIDSEEEGTLLVSCAGGVRVKIQLPIQWEENTSNKVSCAIRVRGLKGGHSGMEINKERGNANKIMGRFLSNLSSMVELQLASLNGGAKMNAIPREMDAVLLVDADKVDLVKERVEVWNSIVKNELAATDAEVRFEFEALTAKVEKVFSKETTEKAITTLYLVPNGIRSMSMNIEGLVESSTNLGVVATSEGIVEFESAVRSSVKTLKTEIVGQMRTLAGVMGAELTTESDYPEWQYKADSQLREVFQKVYKDINGVEPHISAIHAGLECGLFTEKFGDVDMISFGPNLYDVHTPEEHMSISSVERMWDYLVAVLKEIK